MCGRTYPGITSIMKEFGKEKKEMTLEKFHQIIKDKHMDKPIWTYYEAAKEDRRAMCGDTGVPRWYVKMGNTAQVEFTEVRPYMRPDTSDWRPGADCSAIAVAFAAAVGLCGVGSHRESAGQSLRRRR